MLTYHNYNKYENKDTDYVIDKIDYIHGCSIFLNKSIIDKIGYFSDEYFMFFEDLDFCTRAKDRGVELNVSQKSIIIHKEGKSIKKHKLEYIALINRVKYSKKYYPKNIYYVYLGIYYKILKSLLLLEFNLAKKIIINLYR